MLLFFEFLDSFFFNWFIILFTVTVKKMIELVYKLCTKNKEKVNRIAEMEKEIETLKEDIKELKLSFDKTSETKENLTEKMVGGLILYN